MKPPHPFDRFGVLRSILIAVVLARLVVAPVNLRGTPLYWDTNGVNPGSANSLIGIWGGTLSWNTDPLGGSGGSLQMNTTSSDSLFFSAGTNATGPNLITLAGSQSAQGLTFNSGTLTLEGSASPTLTLGSGGLTMSSSLNGMLTLQPTLSNITLAASQTWANESSESLLVSAPVTTNAAGVTLTLAGSGNGTMTFTNSLSNGGGVLAITKNNPATVTLSGQSTYTGPTTINAGTLRAGTSNAAFAPNSAFTLADAAGAALDLSGFDNAIGSLSGGGATGGNVILGSATLSVGAINTSTTFSGRISGAGGLAKFGTGTLTLAASNTYSGPTIINAGTLKAGAATAAFGISSAVSLANVTGAALDITGFNNSIGSLSGGGATGGNVILGSAILTVGAANTSTTFSGRISGTGGITKSGTGTLTLAASNTYTGSTTVNAGTLKAGVAAAFGTNSAVSFANTAGAALDLSGFDNALGSLSGGGTTGGNVILGSATLTVGGKNTSTTFSGRISGTGGLTKIGTATLILTGSQTFSGTTTISSGTLQLGNGTTDGSLTSTSAILNNSSLVFNLAGSLSHSALISGSGSLTKKGTGTLTLSSGNSYSGLTSIQAGTLKLLHANALAGNGTISFSGGTLQFSSTNTTDYASRILNSTAPVALDTNSQNILFAVSLVGSNTGGLTKLGPGTLTLAANNAYTGPTTVSAGTLRAGTFSSAFGSNSAVSLANTAGAILDLNGFHNTLGSLSGGGTIGGNVLLGAATLSVGSNNSSTTFSGSISGTGGLTKLGSGTFTLTGSQAFSGQTTISSGTLQLGNGTTDGSLTSTILNNSSLIFNIAGSLSHSALISGSGSLTKSGSGTLVLSTNHSCSGFTFLNGGALSLAGANPVASTNGIVFGGGTLQFTSGHTLDHSSKIVLSASPIAIDTNGQNILFASSLVGSNTGGLTKLGPGTLTLAANNAYTGPTTVYAGTLKAGTHTSAFGSNSAVSLANTAGAILDLSGFHNTLGSLSGGGTMGGNVLLGSATLSVGSDNSSTTFSGSLSGTGGLTKMGSGTLTLTGSQTFAGPTTISGGALQLGNGTTDGVLTSTSAISNSASLLFNIVQSQTISMPISGSGSLTKTGPGTLILSASNSYSGLTSIQAGTLNLSHIDALAGNGPISFTGGTLQFSGTYSTAYASRILNSTAPVALDTNGQNIPLNGSLNSTNTGGLTKLGQGILTLNANNAYTGPTTIAAGTLRAGTSTAAFGNNSAVSLPDIAGATLDLSGFDNTLGSLSGGGAVGGNVLLGSATLSVGADNSSTTYSGSISGTGGLTKLGSGAFTLAGSQIFAGPTTISSGILQLGNGTTDAALTSTSAILNNGSLVFNLAGSLSHSALISGSGSLTKSGSGTLVLPTNHSYSGLTFINGGTLSLAGANPLASTTGIVFGGGTLQFTSAHALDHSSKIILSASPIAIDTNGQDILFASPLVASNTGGLTKLGPGTLALAADNAYTGPTTIYAGTLRAGASAAFGSNSAVSLANTAGATLDLSGFNTALGSLSGGGAAGGNVLLGSATLSVGSDNSSTTFSGSISGAGGVTKLGLGTLTLAAGNAYSGPTMIAAGTLRAGASAAFGNNSAVSLADTAGATLDLSGLDHTLGSLSGGGAIGGNVVLGSATLSVGSDHSSTTYSGSISGTGGLTKLGPGAFTLAGSQTFAGPTTISSGILQLGNGTTDAALTSTSAILNNGSLVFNLAGSLSHTALISGSGSLVKSGSGTLVLSTNHSYSGLTFINGGTLSLAGANPLASSAGIVFGGGTLQFTSAHALDHSSKIILSASPIAIDTNGQDILFASPLVASNTGGLTKLGPGALTVAADNAYTGPTTVSAGTLRAGASAAFGSNSAVSLANTTGATLDLSGFDTALGSLSGGGAAGGNVLLGSATLSIGSKNANSIYSGVLSGAGSLVKVGSGILTLTASNAYTGPTVVSAGTLRAGASAAAFGNNSAVSLADTAGATLDLSGFDNSLGSLSGGGATGGNVLLGSATLSVGANNSSTTFSGSLSGAGGLTKLGSGTLTLLGSNSYTGLTTVQNGVLVPGTANAFAGAGRIVLSGGILDLRNGAITIGPLTQNSGSLELSIGKLVSVLGSAGLAGTVDVTGTVDAATAGRYTLLSASGTLSGQPITGNLPDATHYYLRVRDASHLDLQRKATIGTWSITPVASAIITGGSTFLNVSLTNSAPLFADPLDATLEGLTNISGTSAISSAPPQATIPINGIFRFTGTSVGAQQTGILRVNAPGASHASADASVEVDVFDHASPLPVGGTLSLGNMRVGYASSVPGINSILVTNAAGYRAPLKGSANISGNFSLTPLAGITAGSSAAIGISLAPGAPAGSLDQSFTYTFADDSSLPGASTALATATLQIRGTVYRPATATLESNGSTLLSGSTLFLGALRIGDSFTPFSLDVRNSAQNTDAFSEKLNASISSGSGSGSASLVAPGSLQANALSVNFPNGSTSTVGPISTSVTVAFQTDGTGTSGLAAAPLASQVLNLAGTVYRKAAPLLASGTLDLGAIRQNGTFTARALTVENTASTDGYSDDLAAWVGSISPGFSSTGTLSRITAGSLDSSTLQINHSGSTASAGLVSGTASIAYASIGRPGTGLSNVAPDHPSDTVAIRGAIYRLAQGTLNTSTLNLGNIRIGSTFGSGTFQVTHAEANDGYSDLLRISQISSSNGFLVYGGTQTLSAAQSRQINIVLSDSPTAIGTTSGTVTLSLASVGQPGTGLPEVALGTQTLYLTISGSVYRPASGLLSPSTIALSPVRENTSFAPGTFEVTNAVANDGFSEKLNATLGHTTGSAVAIGGSIALLSPSNTNNGSLQVSLSAGGTAGFKTGTVRVLFETDGTGTSGIGAESVASGTVQLTGSVYRKAVGSVAPGSVNLGAIRENGSFSPTGIPVNNSASQDGFSDDLSVGIGTGSLGFTTSGAVSRLSAGSLDAASLKVVYNGQTASAGVISGTVSLSYTSLGQPGTGLPDVAPAQPTQTVPISGTIYRTAQGMLSSTTLSLGNVRAGSAFGSGTVQLTNTAPNDGFSDQLRVTDAGHPSGFVILGGSQTLSAGQTGNFSIGLRYTPSAIGTTSGSVSFGLTSVGQPGTGLDELALNTQTLKVLVNGTVYRPGDGVLSSTEVSLGNIREKGTFPSTFLHVANAAPNDGFSEHVNASLGVATGDAVAVGGSVSLLAPSRTNSSDLRVGITSTDTAGKKTGTVQVLFATDGTGTSGIAAESLQSGTATLQGNVYRKAIGRLSSNTIELPPIRENGTFPSKAIPLLNAATNDGFSDDLAAVITATSANFSTAGAVSRLASGSQDTESLRLSYTGATASAGTVAGTATISYVSKGQVGTGLPDAAPDKASEMLNLKGKVYRLARGSISAPASLNFGKVHAGTSIPAETLQISNAAANDGFSDRLQVSPVANSPDVLIAGTNSLLNAAESASYSVGFKADGSRLGLIRDSVAFRLVSVGQSGSGLEDVALDSRTFNISGQIYSGRGVWLGGASGDWNEEANWTLAGGRPGLDGALSRSSDTATFMSTASLPMTVRLPRTVVELNQLHLGGGGGVSLTQNPLQGGSIALAGASPSIHAADGNHFLKVPVVLNQSTSITVDFGAMLTMESPISGTGGFTKLGSGTLLLSAVNPYTGPTTVSVGRLEIGNGARPGIGPITVNSGAELVFRLSSDLVLPNHITGPGRVLSLNNPFRVFWDGGSTPFTGKKNLTIGRGELLDFVDTMLAADSALEILAGTLQVSQSRPQRIPTTVTMEESADFSILPGNTLTISGTISGDAVLRKKSGGVLALTGPNTFVRGTEILAGTIEIQANSALGPGSVRIDQTANLLVNVPAASVITLSNSISGEGELIKVGPGTLTMASTNTHQRGTRVREGALEVGNVAAIGGALTLEGGSLILSGSKVITQPIQFLSASVVQVPTAGKAEFQGTLSGSGDFIKTGAGTLELTGGGALQGRAILEEGSLVITQPNVLSKVPALIVGSAHSDPQSTQLDVRGLARGLQLGAGQTLRGRGTILGNLSLNQAILAPGNSIDVEHVRGNLNLVKSTYQVEYTSENGGKSDRVEVVAGNGMAGTITISGGSVVVTSLDPAPHGPPRRFTILQAEGGIQGRFDGVSPSSGLMRSRLIYGNEDNTPVFKLDLLVQRETLETIGRTGNLRRVGHGLDLVLEGTHPDFVALRTQLDSLLSEEAIRGVLAQFNPLILAEASRLSVQRMASVQRSLADRLTGIGVAALAGRTPEDFLSQPSDPALWSEWSASYGSASNVRSDPVDYFNGYTHQQNGIVSGVERRFGPLTLGFIGVKGSGQVTFTSPSSSAVFDSWHGGAYFSVPLSKRLFADWSVFYGETATDTRRNLGLAAGPRISRSKFETQEWLLLNGFGLQLAPAQTSWSLTPTVRLAYAGFRQGSVSEAGAGSFNLKTNASTNHNALVRSALETAKTWRLAGVPLRASGHAEWVHDFTARSRPLKVRWEAQPGSCWSVSSTRGQPEMLGLGAALEIGLSSQKTIRLYTQHDFFSKSSSTYVGFALNIAF